MLRSVVLVAFISGINVFSVYAIPTVAVQGRLENPLSKSYVRNYTRGSDPPEYWDWRDHKGVSPVKDEEACAACWAFSIVACVESQIAIKFGKQIRLSEQFLIDCAPASNGCAPSNVFVNLGLIVTQLGGILPESAYYPYAKKQLACRWNGKPEPQPVTGFQKIYSDEQAIMKAIWNYGPVIAIINSASMKKYPSGNPIVDEPHENQCYPQDTDHSVLIVGYNTAVSPNGGKVKYWIIKNSWGEDFGDKGFYYLVRGRNACGIESGVSVAFAN